MLSWVEHEFFFITSGLEEEDGITSSTGPDQTAQSEMGLHNLFISLIFHT